MQIVEAAVGEQAGRQGMLSVGVLADGYFVAAGEGYPAGEITEVPALTLDSLSEEAGVIPTHIKIDVEGYEGAVLRGGRRTLSRADSPLLFLELHNQIIRDRNEDPGDVLEQLKSLGYRTFAADGAPLAKDSILNRPLIRIQARK